MTDMTSILARLLPDVGGETPVRHRSAVVTAVNADGTLTVTLSGVSVTVNALAGSTAKVGDTVHLAAWAGDLLALGRTRLTADDVWKSYTPALTAATTNPTGYTATGRYVNLGNLVVYSYQFILGANVGVGTYFVSLPVPGVPGIGGNIGPCNLFDASTGNNLIGANAVMQGSTVLRMVGSLTHIGVFGNFSDAFPWAMGAGDYIVGDVMYEPA